MRTIDFRMDVLRGGVRFGHLRFSEAPSVYADASADIKLTMRGSFLHNDSVDYLKDELQPVVIIDGTDYPVGVYRVVTMLEKHGAEGRRDEIEAYDRSILLTWSKLEQRDYWPAGTPYDDVISSYLVRAGISRVSFVPTGHVLQSSREDWDIGTSYLTIINTLLEEINYNPIWFDLNGVAQLTPYEQPSAANIRHTYGPNAVKLISPEYSAEIDLYSKPNVFIAILSNPEYSEPLVARAEIETPSSELSTVRRGIRIPQVYKVDNIASADELQAYVNRLRDKGMQTSVYVDVSTAIMPTHAVGDIVALTVLGTQGIFRETSWSFSMEAGTWMNHKLERVIVA